MYEYYKPSERVFVNRAEELQWMEDALRRCKRRSVIHHIYGIGGIGKSALFNYWDETFEPSILVDCSRYVDFYERLDVIARRTVQLGMKLERFDILWHLRQRFVKGVEPAKESGRGWAFDILQNIPFIGSLSNIGLAIHHLGKELMPGIKSRLGSVGGWLRNRLGKNYGEKLLEILWREPAHAEFLFIDALLEDLNHREKKFHPLIIIFDQFEDIDHENLRWTYKKRRIHEKEMWCIFLSSLMGSVGIIGSRETLDPQIISELKIETSELTELNDESCRELLSLRGISDEGLQEQIIRIAHGHPFVNHAVCDIAELIGVSENDIESLYATTLEEVRLKTWRRLFNRAQDMLEFIDRAGLVLYFDKQIMSIIAPRMKSHHWERLKNLSFVRDRGDGTWELHDLARELVIAELGQRLNQLTNEVSDYLEKASEQTSDYSLLGMAIFSTSLASEADAIASLREVVCELVNTSHQTDALSVLSSVRFSSNLGIAVRLWLKGRALNDLNRVADAEHAIKDAIDLFREIAQSNQDTVLKDLAAALFDHAFLLRRTSRPTEAEEAYREALWLQKELAKKYPDTHLGDLAMTLRHFAWVLALTRRPQEAERTYEEALEIQRELAQKVPKVYLSEAAQTLNELGALFRKLGRVEEAEDATREALEMLRDLDKLVPRMFQSNIALVHYNLADILRQTGRPVEAEEALLEGLEIHRSLATRSPEVFMQNLAQGLRNLSVLLRQMGRPSEAENAIREAIGILEVVAERAPEACYPYMAWSYRNLAILLRLTGRSTESEESFRNALRIYKELSEKAPHIFARSVSYTLSNWVTLLWQTGKLPEARAAIEEALEICREQTDVAPSIFSKYMAMLLSNYAIVLSRIGQSSRSLEVHREAIRIRSQLVNRSPKIYLPDLAVSLNNLGVSLRREGQLDDAEEAHREALNIRWKLATNCTLFYNSRLATSLNNTGVVLAERSRMSEALEIFNEALTIRRDLVSKSPELYESGLVSTLSNLGILHGRMGQVVEAKKSYTESLEIIERLYEKDPEMYRGQLVACLSNLTNLLLKEKENTSDEFADRLRKFGIKKTPKHEIWIEEEEEEELGF